MRKDNMTKIYSFAARREIRSPITDNLKEEYRNFLELKYLHGDVWALLSRLKARAERAALDNLVERVMEQEGDGRNDKEFMVWMGGFFKETK
jgi:hypothetical protein